MNKEIFTIGEIGKLTGLTVRALHYYDSIGLLTPKVNPQNKYRIYGKEDLAHIQQILFFREVGFELLEIKNILSSKNFNKKVAFIKQKELLMAKKDRLTQIIELIDNIMEEKDMSFKEFDNSKVVELQKEAKERWGKTNAYMEFEEKAQNKTDWSAQHKEMQNIFLEMSKHMDKGISAVEVVEGVMALQSHITKHYYNCTDEILKGLGQMYVADKRFKENLDSIKEGFAVFLSAAIEELTN